MKIQGEKFALMQAAMKAVVDHYGPLAIRRWFGDKNEDFLLWWSWNQAYDNLLYDDSHPIFTSLCRPRVHPQVPGFNIYDGDINDDHIETALRRIGREIGLVGEWEKEGDYCEVCGGDRDEKLVSLKHLDGHVAHRHTGCLHHGFNS